MHSLGRFLFFAATFFLVQQAAQAAVWVNAKSWSPAEEDRYAAWVKANLTTEFFLQPGTWYYGMTMDCAKAVYGIRAVYAAENALPYIVSDPTGGRKTISNSMSRWDSLPEPERKRKFLRYIMDIKSTVALPSDTYPVAVNRDAIRGGTVIRSDAKSHHSWTVRYVANIGIPELMFSTRPPRSRLLERFDYPSVEFLFKGNYSPSGNAGFRNWRSKEELGRPLSQITRASFEQFRFPLHRWRSEMQRHLQLTAETPVQRLSRLLDEACKGATERISFVNEGLAFVNKLNGHCMTAAEYDDYSTPGRDSRLQSAFASFQAQFDLVKNQNIQISEALLQQAEAVIAKEESVHLAGRSYCPVALGDGQILTLGQVYARSLAGTLSSNPYNSRDTRWGLSKVQTQMAQSCPQYD